MTEPMITGTLPYRVYVLHSILPRRMFGFPTPEARDAFLVAWTAMCEDGEISLPAEGVEYVLEGPT